MTLHQYIKHQYKLLIGERTAENIKFKVGTVFPGAEKNKSIFGDAIWFRGFHAQLQSIPMKLEWH